MKNRILNEQLSQSRLKDAGEFPKVVLIDTISFCNLKCSMCVHKDMKRKKGVMPWNLFKKIVDEIAQENKDTRVWMVFFGEALLLKKTKPSIFEMIAYAKKKGLTDVVLNSNANLLDKNAAKKLINSGLDAIYIGLDAFTAETYSRMRCGGNYELTVSNIRYLIDIKRLMRSKRPEIFIQFVEMDINRVEKDDFIKFWNNQGVTVKIRPKVSWAGLIDAAKPSISSKNRWPCHWAMQTMSITDSGKVVTCAVDLDARFIAGNMNSQNLKEIWNGKLKELRDLHSSHQFSKLPSFCRRCNDWQFAKADFYLSS